MSVFSFRSFLRYRFLVIFIMGALVCGCRPDQSSYRGNMVEISGSKGQWELVVNGKPFRLKGAGVSRISGKFEKADFLKLAKELGANTVRTWGIDQGTLEYLNKAQEYGLYVNAGIWMNPVYSGGEGSYRNDEKYKNAVAKGILAYVEKNKEHPSILFWNIGNEVFYWTKDEDERVAFAKFLEEIIQEVHRIDPYHPVIYATAYTTAVPYIKKYIPSLDILGVNIYGGFDRMHQEVIANLDIPYVVTEYGTLGPWDSVKDMNGISVEANDEVKANDYKKFAHAIKGVYGYCLGGFTFVLGDTTQTSSTWWNITHGAYPKYSYAVIQEFYTGTKMKSVPPVIKDVVLSKRKDLLPGEEFTVEVKLRSEEEALTYEYFVTTASETTYLEEYPNHPVPVDIEVDGPRAKIRAPSLPEIYRVYAVVRNDKGAAGTFNKSITVVKE